MQSPDLIFISLACDSVFAVNAGIGAVSAINASTRLIVFQFAPIH